MDSILDNSHLDDFIAIHQMEDEEFEVHRPGREEAQIVTVEAVRTQEIHLTNFNFSHLTFPKRPAWKATMTAEEIDRNEKRAFLDWRRQLALLESAHNFNIKLTPFEKNLDVWRQLWRVCERSDILLQVVDARNPMLYFTKELAEHVLAMNPSKHMVLVLNKADLLTPFQRQQWADFLAAQGWPFVFYSARKEEARLQARQAPLNLSYEKDLFPQEDDIVQRLLGMFAEQKQPKHGSAAEHAAVPDEESEEVVWGDVSDEDEDDDQSENEEEEEEEQDEKSEKDHGQTVHKKSSAKAPEQPSFRPVVSKADSSLSTVLSRESFLYVLHALSRALPSQRTPFCVGLVGYPNVGKSSLINSLLGVTRSSHNTVRVAVSSTPGKTKHFQTLVLSPEVLLCDCPGLVFPSIMASAAEMLCSGVLPINQMRDHEGPAQVILSRVPAAWLEALYGLRIIRQLDALDRPDRPPTPTEFLSAYCKLKTYVTSGPGGRWDEFRACKEIIRDFNDGKVLYVSMPPHCSSPSEEEQRRWLRETESIMTQNARMAERLLVQKLRDIDLQEVAGEDDDDDEEMVFPVSEGNEGGNKGHFEAEFEDGGYEIITEDTLQDLRSSEQAEEVVIGAGGKPKREHKRVKTWGKKGRKLRDRNPYDTEEMGTGGVSFVAHTTNRKSPGCNLIQGRR